MALYEMKNGERVLVHRTEPQQPPVNAEQAAAVLAVVASPPAVRPPSQSQAADGDGESESPTKRKKQGGDK